MRDKHIGSLFASFCIGLCGILYLALFLTGSFRMPAHGGGWIYEYQTLIAGLAAIGSAWSVLYPYRETRKNRGRVLRARLVRSVPVLQVHTTNYLRYIFKIIPQLPDRPQDFDLLSDIIEVADKRTSKHILKLIVFAQIHDSRLSNYDLESSRNSYQFKQVIVDLIVLSHYIMELYSYARFELDEISPSLISEKDVDSVISNILRHDIQLMAHEAAIREIAVNHFGMILGADRYNVSRMKDA